MTDELWLSAFIVELIAEGLNQNSPEARFHVGCSFGLYQKWLPLLDTLRTRLLMPDDALKWQMEVLRRDPPTAD